MRKGSIFGGSSNRKRVRILPGITLNQNKNSVSVSVGGTGYRVTYGKNGVRTTVGIPGTGIRSTSYRRREVSSTSKIPIRSRATNRTYAFIFFFLAIICIVLTLISPGVNTLSRYIIVIVGGGILLLASFVFFTVKSLEDFEENDSDEGTKNDLNLDTTSNCNIDSLLDRYGRLRRDFFQTCTEYYKENPHTVETYSKLCSLKDIIDKLQSSLMELKPNMSKEQEQFYDRLNSVKIDLPTVLPK